MKPPGYSAPSWDPHREKCEWVSPENKKEFFVPLIVLNSVIVGIAFLHFLLCIWGIVIASKALHKDDTCGRCFANCFCGGCCGGIQREETGVCGDGCSRGQRNGPCYQPVQFVVWHQGMTTMADGKQALVVLLPLNGNMSVKMAADSATVTVDHAEPQERGPDA